MGTRMENFILQQQLMPWNGIASGVLREFNLSPSGGEKKAEVQKS